jgi:hypothetical protein
MLSVSVQLHRETVACHHHHRSTRASEAATVGEEAGEEASEEAGEVVVGVVAEVLPRAAAGIRMQRGREDTIRRCREWEAGVAYDDVQCSRSHPTILSRGSHAELKDHRVTGDVDLRPSLRFSLNNSIRSFHFIMSETGPLLPSGEDAPQDTQPRKRRVSTLAILIILLGACLFVGIRGERHVPKDPLDRAVYYLRR